MTYIREKYPELFPLYEEIYNKKKLDYWQALEQDISQYAQTQGFPYRVNDLPYGRSEKGKPVIVNYFYHEKIRLKTKGECRKRIMDMVKDEPGPDDISHQV